MNSKHKEKGHKLRKTLVIVKFSILLAILIAIPIYIFVFHKELIAEFSSISALEDFLKAHKNTNILLFLGLQVLQIVISVIPGQPLQFAAAIAFGALFALILSLLGAVIGSVIAYFIAMFLGHDALLMIFGEQKIKIWIEKLNSKRGMIIVFVLFLIPGLPKDILNYAAGISEMKLKVYILISTVARIPGMMGSILIGRYTSLGNYTVVIIIAAVFVGLFIVGYIKKDKIIELTDKIYDKLIKM